MGIWAESSRKKRWRKRAESILDRWNDEQKTQTLKREKDSFILHFTERSLRPRQVNIGMMCLYLSEMPRCVAKSLQRFKGTEIYHETFRDAQRSNFYIQVITHELIATPLGRLNSSLLAEMSFFCYGHVFFKFPKFNWNPLCFTFWKEREHNVVGKDEIRRLGLLIHLDHMISKLHQSLNPMAV